VVRLKKITKQYNNKVILNGIDFQCEEGQIIAIKGKSGIGKSTLLNIVAGLERATSGDYFYQDTQMNNKSISFLTNFRRMHIGYISQHSPMIPELTVMDNICVPLWFEKNEDHKKQAMKHVKELGHLFEIDHLLNENVKTLSGGELQRAGIIRALINKPTLIIADEPTGALDDETASIILTHFHALKSEGVTTILATHSEAVSSQCDEIYTLNQDGLSLER